MLPTECLSHQMVIDLESTPVYCQGCINSIVLCQKVAAHNELINGPDVATCKK